jgi:hypothetical protein
MVGRFQETENGGAAIATASPNEVTQKPEVVDFEKLLGDLSAAFIRVSVEEIDREIDRWLQRIVLALDVDRGTVIQLEGADGALFVTHQWARQGVSAPFEGLKMNVPYPWLASKVLSGELVVNTRIEDLPPEAYEDLATARREGVKSHVTVPLSIGRMWSEGCRSARLLRRGSGLSKKSSASN